MGSPTYSISGMLQCIDVNNDDKPDILLAGNFYPNSIQMGKYDGDYGAVLINEGKGNFRLAMLNGLYNKRRSKTRKTDPHCSKRSIYCCQ